MIPVQRHRRILELLADHEIMTYSELAEKINVSQMTIRRDVAQLAKIGKVNSVQGGVELADNLLEEPSHAAKLALCHQEKKDIAILAVAQITDAMHVVYLDAGTTCLEIAKALSHRDDLLIITNDFEIVQYLLNNSQLPLIHIGGEINRSNHSSVGPIAAEVLEKLHIDIAFISSSSWDLKGLFTPESAKVPVKKAIVHASNTTCLVSDSSKYEQRAVYFIYSLQEFDTIITDQNIPDSAVKKITEMGIEILIA